MATALEIITGAARLLGVVRKGEALDGDEAETGLAVLNELIQSWSTQGLLTNGPVREVITLTSAAIYLLGDGLFEETITDPITARTVDMTPPLKILSAFIRSGSIDYPVEIGTDEEYDNIPIKSISGTPYFMSYTTGEGLVSFNDLPDPILGIYSGTIRLYPSPSAGDELHILCEKMQSDYVFFSDKETLPGWTRALRYNLALELAPEYSVNPSPVIVKIAAESLGAIKLANAKNRKMRGTDDVSVSNIYTGYY